MHDSFTQERSKQPDWFSPRFAQVSLVIYGENNRTQKTNSLRWDFTFPKLEKSILDERSFSNLNRIARSDEKTAQIVEGKGKNRNGFGGTWTYDSFHSWSLTRQKCSQTYSSFTKEINFLFIRNFQDLLGSSSCGSSAVRLQFVERARGGQGCSWLPEAGAGGKVWCESRVRRLRRGPGWNYLPGSAHLRKQQAAAANTRISHYATFTRKPRARPASRGTHKWDTSPRATRPFTLSPTKLLYR